MSRAFKVGDKIEILEPEEMGITPPARNSGDVVTIERIGGDGVGMCDLCFGYMPKWIDDGYIRFADDQ